MVVHHTPYDIKRLWSEESSWKPDLVLYLKEALVPRTSVCHWLLRIK